MFATLNQLRSLKCYARGGFVFMDHNDPQWAMEFGPNAIFLYKFDMGDEDRCVFGFREGNFWDGVHKYHLSLFGAEQLGLVAPVGVPYWIANPILTRLWKMEIERQRAAFRHIVAEGARARLAARGLCSV